ncbi:MAG: glycosyltransferase family 4 protein [Ginsengibacter sp.]
MKVLFLTLIKINSIEEHGIYTDLLRKFRDEGHEVFIVTPVERRYNISTNLSKEKGATILQIKTLNLQKANNIERGIGTLAVGSQFLKGIKKWFIKENFDLILYSTPPITFSKAIKFLKKKDKALTYLLLKDIFPQNALDIGFLAKGSLLYKIFAKKEKELYAISDFIGCMSPANVEFLKRHQPQIPETRLEVNPNSIEIAQGFNVTDGQKTVLKNNFNLPKRSTVCIYGGNLGKPQGIDFLIRVLDYWQNHEEVFFMIVGSGTEFRKLSKWVTNRSLKNIRLIPFLPKEEYDELIKACDIGLIFLDKRFTIPNFPSRLLSYLKNRMPVLCAIDKQTDVGRILEDHNAGLWSESGDLEKFNENLKALLADKQLIKEMGNAGHDLLIKEFTVDRSYHLIMNRVAKPIV